MGGCRRRKRKAKVSEDFAVVKEQRKYFLLSCRVAGSFLRLRDIPQPIAGVIGARRAGEERKKGEPKNRAEIAPTSYAREIWRGAFRIDQNTSGGLATKSRFCIFPSFFRRALLSLKPIAQDPHLLTRALEQSPMSLTDASLNAVASTSRLGACETCLLVPSRYTCPLCQHKTCSLPCSKRHKLVLACSGIALKVHQKDVKANEWNWGNLMRDQSYLSEVSRIIEGNGKELVSGQLLPSASSFGSRSSNDFAGGVGGMVGAPGGGRLDELSDKEARIVREAARSEGVRLVILPKGMSRRGRNATKWDQTCVDSIVTNRAAAD